MDGFASPPPDPSWWTQFISQVKSPAWVADAILTLLGAGLGVVVAVLVVRRQLKADRELHAAALRANAARAVGQRLRNALRVLDVNDVPSIGYMLAQRNDLPGRPALVGVAVDAEATLGDGFGGLKATADLRGVLWATAGDVVPSAPEEVRSPGHALHMQLGWAITSGSWIGGIDLALEALATALLQWDGVLPAPVVALPEALRVEDGRGPAAFKRLVWAHADDAVALRPDSPVWRGLAG